MAAAVLVVIGALALREIGRRGSELVGSSLGEGRAQEESAAEAEETLLGAGEAARDGTEGEIAAADPAADARAAMALASEDAATDAPGESLTGRRDEPEPTVTAVTEPRLREPSPAAGATVGRRPGGVQQPPDSSLDVVAADGSSSGRPTEDPAPAAPSSEPGPPDGEPEAPTPAAGDAEPDAAVEIAYDLEMQTATALRFRVEPADSYVAVRGPLDDRFVQIGQAEEYQAGRRRARDFDLPGEGTYYLLFRREGLQDVVMRIEARPGTGPTVIALDLRRPRG